MAWISAVTINTANYVSVEMISHNKYMYFNPESEQMKKHCQVMLYSSCSSFQIFHILYKSLNLPAQGRLLNKLLDSIFLKWLLLGHGAVIKWAVLLQSCNQLHIGNSNPTHVTAGLSEIYFLWCKHLWKNECFFLFALCCRCCFSLAEYI